MGIQSLRSAKKGESFRIVDVVSGHSLSDRFLELGLQAGELISVVHEAPVSRDPIVLDLFGTRFALRRDEADLILVEKIFAERGSDL